MQATTHERPAHRYIVYLSLERIPAPARAGQESITVHADDVSIGDGGALVFYEWRPAHRLRDLRRAAGFQVIQAYAPGAWLEVVQHDPVKKQVDSE